MNADYMFPKWRKDFVKFLQAQYFRMFEILKHFCFSNLIKKNIITGKYLNEASLCQDREGNEQQSYCKFEVFNDFTLNYIFMTFY